MAATLLLNVATWDLSLNASGNIALADATYSLAQDAASAIKTFLGECYWNTTIGIPWLTQILSPPPPQPPPSLALIKEQLVNAALTVPGVSSARVFIAAFDNRSIQGQVQIISTSGQADAANFAVSNPQGAG